MHSCKGICRKFEAERGKKRYSHSPRCSQCDLFLNTKYVKGSHCPCCSYHLRYKVRTRRPTNTYKRI